MKRKALIVGALPSQFEGPWVVLSDAEAWRVTGERDYGEGNVAVEVVKDESLPNSILYTDSSLWPVIIKGVRARAVILKSFNGVPHVSVTAEATGSTWKAE